MSELTPNFSDVQTHYDLSDDFFELFLDPSRTYSCAYFEEEDYSLERAQRAKIELSLDKCELKPGMTLLDVGCGWGATMIRALEEHHVRVIGLTLSKNQYAYVADQLSKHPRGHRGEVRLQGWEEFDEPVDRIVSIGAFEHFRRERYDAFFEKCSMILPDDGRMLLHTIVGLSRHHLASQGIRLNRQVLEFGRFIQYEIFPGGQLPQPEWVTSPALDAGFRVDRVQALRPHYARTLTHWADALEARREDAIELTSVATYDTYMKYLRGCSDMFRDGYIDVMQFSLARPGAGVPSAVNTPPELR